MPYKVIGKKGGKWSVKQTCDSHENAIKAMQLLQGLEHGSIKPEDVGRGKFAKSGGSSASKGRKYKVLYRS